MCELFGVSSLEKVRVNDWLQVLASHSVRHPHGWGLATFFDGGVSLEKEPLPAYQSMYLKQRLRHRLEVRNMIGHIRLATRGVTEYENCHPFVQRDALGRSWTLAHNGTMFDCPALSPYTWVQEGQTDSERVLCLLIAEINAEQVRLGRAMTPDERFVLLDRLICQLAPHNKLNLLLFDGEFLYVHTNYARSLFCKQLPGTAVFATVPLDLGTWEPLPFCTLVAYKDGQLCRRGTTHGAEYKDNPEDQRLLFADYSGL